MFNGALSVISVHDTLTIISLLSSASVDRLV